VTPKERFQAALNLEKPDRIPLLYQHLGGGAWVLESCGKTLEEGFKDPKVFAKIATTAQKLYGFDNVMAGWGDLLVEAQAHGKRWTFVSKDQYPRASSYIALTPKNIDAIQPVDPIHDRYWSVQLKAAGILQMKIGKDVEVVGCINSPFIIASETIGFDKLMISLLKNPALIHKLLARITESAKIYADRVANDCQLDSIFIADGTAGGDQISLDLCSRFDLNYLKELIDHCHLKCLKTIVQNGSSAPYIDAQVALKPDAIHFNNRVVDLEKAFGMFRGKLCVVSGVDHMELLLRGTPGDVEKETKRAIDLFGRGPGLVLSGGSEIPFNAPIENIKRLKQAAERYGRY